MSLASYWQRLTEGVAYFEALDETSTAFRYPDQRDGKNALEGHNYLNLKDLQAEFWGGADQLEQLVAGIEWCLDQPGQ